MMHWLQLLALYSETDTMTAELCPQQSTRPHMSSPPLCSVFCISPASCIHCYSAAVDADVAESVRRVAPCCPEARIAGGILYRFECHKKIATHEVCVFVLACVVACHGFYYPGHPNTSPLFFVSGEMTCTRVSSGWDSNV